MNTNILKIIFNVLSLFGYVCGIYFSFSIHANPSLALVWLIYSFLTLIVCNRHGNNKRE